MNTRPLPVGSFIQIEKSSLQSIIDELRGQGYRVMAPTVAEEAVVYGEVESLDQLPIGIVDEQDGGRYRLHESDGAAYFDYVVGPQSLKPYVFPAEQTVVEGIRADGTWQMKVPTEPEQPVAVIGVRSCDLHALRVQDRTFINDKFVDPAYQRRRENLFLVAVNCRRAAATCFCHSMRTGPGVDGGFDLAMTELDDQFVIEVGSERGGQVVLATDWTPCTTGTIDQARAVPQQLARAMHERTERVAVTSRTADDSQTAHAGHAGDAPCAADAAENGQPRPRHLDTTDIRDLLMNNLNHPRWDTVAERCLACTNCTLVCPTCFCSSVDEVTDLTGDSFRRQRRWDSCFTDTHSYMTSGAVRSSTRARYRQWLTHKLATWIDQFGTSGCVGCGRCITWCPVGIDLTEEVAAIRETAS